MATISARLVEVQTQIDKLIGTGIRRYRTGLSEVEKILLSDLQNERKELLKLKAIYGLDYDEAIDEIPDTSWTNNVSFT